MVRLCAVALGSFAFAITILLGLNAGNPEEVVLQRALWVMLIFLALGWAVGWIAFRVVDEHAIHLHKEMFPTEEEARAIESKANSESTRGTGDT